MQPLVPGKCERKPIHFTLVVSATAHLLICYQLPGGSMRIKDNIL